MAMFNDENFLLSTPSACKLYHDYAEGLPIIDYHCHLNPQYVAADHQFENLSKIWLEGDHYKWRAMRTNGVDEKFITGRETSDWEKFEKWAETVPYTMRNLYHWTHLELKTAFGVEKLLSPGTASEIYEKCTDMLHQADRSARGLMKHYNVEVVCTTDDPADSLEHHISVAADKTFEVKMLPTWRPDKAMAVENPEAYKQYVDKLSAAAGMTIATYADLLSALQKRHDFFASAGCRLSDHGIEEFYAEDVTPEQASEIFDKVYKEGKCISSGEIAKFKTAMLLAFAEMDHDSGWTQQFHYGAIRDNNTRMFRQLGPDTGFDSIGDFTVAKKMSRFFDILASRDKLAKTIIYNLNPRDNELVATMLGNFQDGRYGAGKIQFGSGWWFLDQKDGMERQMNALSNLGLLSRFVGMLTDSRSFLSYPRHEYFRRTLCNLLGSDIDNGLLPLSEIDFIGREIVAGICYGNAKQYFKF
ncbi:glucuronate isomerase [uncultured Muribaculum sp.]|uniref:glucuronate isomerase n=1 Tax=uncultured Muribaculum sp. TaxID=1918613 RepID=UPI00266FCA2B|nr:glucuronate isomerase [uncultured Muribaculum sp.]